MTRGSTHRRLATLALAALAALAIAGCGDDDEQETTAATTGATGATGPAAQEIKIAVSETEYALEPANPTVSLGQATIKVTNDGEIAHNLEVEGPAGEEELEQDLQPGESDTLEVDLSKPGTYEWYCPIGNHADLGMEGEITVE